MRHNPKVYFRWMGTFWTCTLQAWAALEGAAVAGKPLPDFETLGVKELKYKPRDYEVLMDAHIRREER